MPTVICRHCGRPWMDTKYDRCPHCQTAIPASDEAGGEAVSPAPVGPPPPGAITSAQADRIIGLLEGDKARSLTASRARGLSGTLDTLAGVVLVLGGLVAIIQFVLALGAGFGVGAVVTALVTMLSAGCVWGLLSAAAVTMIFVAERSE